MAESILSGVNRSLANFIPLVLRKNELDFRKALFEEEQQAEEAKIQEDARKAKFDFVKQQYLDAVKTGNQDIANQLGPEVEARGGTVAKKTVQPQALDPLSGLPTQMEKLQYLVNKPKENTNEPTSIGGALARLFKDNPQKLLELYSKEKPKKIQELNTYAEAAIFYRENGDLKKAKIYEDLAKKAASEKTSSTPAEREKTSLIADIQQDRQKLAGIESGQDIMTEAYQKESPKVVKRFKKALMNKLKSYEKKYGRADMFEKFGIGPEDFEDTDPAGIR